MVLEQIQFTPAGMKRKLGPCLRLRCGHFLEMFAFLTVNPQGTANVSTEQSVTFF